MSNKLYVALVQTDLFWNNPMANKNYFDTILSRVGGADVIILPEMFTTAFCMQGSAEPMNGTSIQWMLQKAKSLNAAVCGSLIIYEDNQQYNRFVWATPNGDVEYYNKRHLFSLMGEKDRFAVGVERKLIHYKGWKIFPQICYDLRFPAWDKLLQARAIENQSYVVGVNRVGNDVNNISFPGHSAVYGALGETLVYLGEEEKVERATLDMEVLKETRERLPFLKDRDGFTLSS